MVGCEQPTHTRQEALTHLQADLDATARQAVETDNRLNALSADLEEAHAKGRVVQDRLEKATAEVERLRAELDGALIAMMR